MNEHLSNNFSVLFLCVCDFLKSWKDFKVACVEIRRRLHPILQTRWISSVSWLTHLIIANRAGQSRERWEICSRDSAESARRGSSEVQASTPVNVIRVEIPLYFSDHILCKL